MGNGNDTIELKLSFSPREDGTLEAAYIQFRRGEVAETRELEGSAILGDYDANGKLLGIEILAPVRIADLKKYTNSQQGEVLEHIAPKSLSDLVGCG